MTRSKRLKGLVLITVYLMLMLVTVFAASYIVAHAEEPPVEEAKPEKTWYKVKNDTLMVYLTDASEDGFKWRYSISNENRLRMSWSALTSGDGYIASFKPTGEESGEVTVSYNLLSNYEDSPIDNRYVKLRIKDDKSIELID